ncbi:hypothetical protein [Streptomyces coffeae]|uniref:Uncharacterized protein n=1 Tax=Streptomyces coffeae TaxID=621382 RepID=A0ABS1NR90_9ACTN|nr:hypothetical protein [Streptomyces coffeae]MBL1102619.1 hypothetical protein [Streptomyces coffeae]
MRKLGRSLSKLIVAVGVSGGLILGASGVATAAAGDYHCMALDPEVCVWQVEVTPGVQQNVVITWVWNDPSGPSPSASPRVTRTYELGIPPSSEFFPTPPAPANDNAGARWVIDSVAIQAAA